MLRAALGIRAHSGWAVVVALAGETNRCKCVLRRRIELVTATGFRANQPYHAAAEMELSEAERFLEETARAAAGMASEQVKRAVETLATGGWRAERATVLLGSGRPLPGLESTLASHPLIHTAEGELYRGVLKSGCEACGLAVSGVKEREVWETCAAKLGITVLQVKARVAAMGKEVGPPWTQDEKLSAAAAWTALAETGITAGATRISGRR